MEKFDFALHSCPVKCNIHNFDLSIHSFTELLFLNFENQAPCISVNKVF